MKLAHEDHLADMVCVMRSNVSYIGGAFLDGGVIRGLHELLDIRHHLIQLANCFRPLLGIEVVIEGLIVVAVEFSGIRGSERGQLALVPKEQVRGKLPDGMIAAAIGPLCLLGREPFDCGVDGDKPFGLVMGAAQLIQQNAFQRLTG